MKSTLRIALVLLCATTAYAKPQPPPSLLDGRPPLTGGPFKKLPDGLRERVEAAQKKAMAEPGIREAREKIALEVAELRERVRKSMFEIDPGLEVAIRAEMPNAKLGNETKRQPDGIAGLQPEQRKELLAKREAVKDEPEVVAAREALDRAKTPAERKEAGAAYRAAMENAVRGE